MTCKIKEKNGFLKYACYSEDSKYEINKCVMTEEYYRTRPGKYVYFKGDVCSNDPNFYQACDKYLGGKITNNEVLCEYFVCQAEYLNNWGEVDYILSSDVFSKVDGCNYKCSNTDLNKEGCNDERIALPSGAKVSPGDICNDICDVRFCEDEAVCNGFTYGLYCKSNHRIQYIPLLFICDGYSHCDKGEDDTNCEVTEHTKSSCTHYNPDVGTVPVLNYTKCGLLHKSTFLQPKISHNIISIDTKAYCVKDDIGLFQTNCTDPLRVGVTCKINGYSSTVSKYLICYDEEIAVCDEKIDSTCLWTQNCNVHKHLMCDYNNDCYNRLDETHPTCLSVTNATCRRRVGGTNELPIPISWIKDGVWDCESGADETEDWPTCGEGKTFRYRSSDTECENVFLCKTGDSKFIELSFLCDGLETCGNENVICSLSGHSLGLKTAAFTADNGLTKRFSYCFKGLHSLEILSGGCVSRKFIFPDEEIFGVDTKTSLILPNHKQSCDHMYGEFYLYTSCIGRCYNASCPLKTVPRYEVCPSQFPDRVGTLVNNEYLIFFTKSFKNIYTNRYFVCEDNTTCIDYSKVCDLVYDCNDQSDEKYCTNHFQCKTSGHLLPKTKKCDGHIDCSDLTDECNEQCSKSILEGPFLKGLSWLIGLLAVMANAAIIVKSLKALKRCKTAAAFMNRFLIIMIALGDFLMGCYLLIIAIYDTIIFKTGYCHEQISWVTSFECSAIGIISTVGSQISLFSMTGLSIVRIHGIWNSMRVPQEITKLSVSKVVLTMLALGSASAALALVPILETFEDFFVNGVKFSDRLRIFIGTPGKAEVARVIKAYHGRSKETTLRWKTLIEMVTEMFSRDLHYEDFTKKVDKVDFYGNDGVCLFKYFVQSQDPQRVFVWSTLSLNFVCFFIISISYLLIAILSRRSAKNLETSKSDRQFTKRNNKMNQKIAMIITTDFLCWVPFITICILHSFEVIDGSQWYSILSMVILPINSVINPFLYDKSVMQLMWAPFRKTFKRTGVAIFESVRAKLAPTSVENIALHRTSKQEEETTH